MRPLGAALGSAGRGAAPAAAAEGIDALMRSVAIIELTNRCVAALRRFNTATPYGQRWSCPACQRALNGDEQGLCAHARGCGLLRASLRLVMSQVK
jgi:hypothetical protein